MKQIPQAERELRALLLNEDKKAGFSTCPAIPSMYVLTREEYRHNIGEPGAAKSDGHGAAFWEYMDVAALMLHTNLCTRATALSKLPTVAAKASGESRFTTLSPTTDPS